MSVWNDILKELKSRAALPKNINASEWNGWNIISTFDTQSAQFISESVSMGISRNSELAVKKGIVEYCERQAIQNATDPAIFLTKRSDGFAAFPKINLVSQGHARQNALNEAVERYLWVKWWDDGDIFFKFREQNLSSQTLDALKHDFNVQKVHEIVVSDRSEKFALLILLAENSDGGYLTGGACECVESGENHLSNLEERAFGELLRHLLAFNKIKNAPLSTLSFYEQRLLGFASGRWAHKVKLRLNQCGESKIFLPNLVVDKEISHPNDDLICLYRCLFENQPVFMGGDVDRLCI